MCFSLCNRETDMKKKKVGTPVAMLSHLNLKHLFDNLSETLMQKILKV